MASSAESAGLNRSSSETEAYSVDDDDRDCCIHGVGWDEDCPDCNDYEDEADGL